MRQSALVQTQTPRRPRISIPFPAGEWHTTPMSLRRWKIRLGLLPLLCAVWVGCASVPSKHNPAPADAPHLASAETFPELLGAFVEEHCSTCHKGAEPKGGIDLVTYAQSDPTLESEAVWESVLDMLNRGAMPPEDRPRPDPGFVAEVVQRIDAELARVAATVKPDPGRVTARRLNRAEYAYTVLDLLGVEFDATRYFPTDDSGYGFDTIADVLSTSPLHMEKYFAAAERIAGEAVPLDPARDDKTRERYARLFICGHAPADHTAACARTIIQPLAERAYRRPVSRREISRLVSFVDYVQSDGGSFEEGVRLAVEAMLVSPQFLFRIERNDSPRNPDAMHTIDPFELASRMSYFLWSSMPDDTLLDAARSARLLDPAERAVQVRRMLADDKSARLVENFAGQWLELRNLPLAYRASDVFPGFNSDLRRAMGEETRLFFTAIVKEDRSLLEFIDADYTFLNQRLAEHYGIAGIEGDQFRRVGVDREQRGGILTHASLLTLTAYPTRTSPVLRGKWILENILGTPPPPPPDNVPPLPDGGNNHAKTLREQVEQHRADPACASCHARMDPLGFGLENYDAIGRWRLTDGDQPVDSSGKLPSGEAFTTPRELKSLLLDHRDQFVHTFAEKMLTYALGRGLERYDRAAIETIAREVEADGYRFSRVVLGIVESLPFQMRRGDDRGGNDA